MFYFAQVNIGTNIGTNFASLLGFIQIIFGLLYLILAIIKLVLIWNRISSLRRTSNIILLLITPTFLISSGLILLFQGWRLDPILQLQQFILSFLVFYFASKDIVVDFVTNRVQRNR